MGAAKTWNEELEKELGVSLDGPKYNPFRDQNYWGDPGLYDMLPYVVCHHEISDSAFYSGYKEFRESFAKKGSISESIKARAADACILRKGRRRYMGHDMGRACLRRQAQAE